MNMETVDFKKFKNTDDYNAGQFEGGDSDD